MPEDKVDERLVRAIQYALYQYNKGKSAGDIMEYLEKALDEYIESMDGRVGRA